MGNASGVLKTAARRVGASVEEYQSRSEAGEKWCSRCRAWHPTSDFGADRSRASGLSARCEPSRIASVGRPGRAERRNEAARGRAWCRHCGAWQSLTDVRSGLCAQHRRAVDRAQYARSSDGRHRRIHARRRELDPVPGWWINEGRERWNGRCAYGCGRSGASLDHVWPVVRGGKSRPGNLVPACIHCNSSKGPRLPRPWVERGFAAFPDQWENLLALAMEHNSDDWMMEGWD